MKIRNWMMAGVLTLTSVLMLTLPVSAVTCPAGTNRQGSSASTLAECNIENDNSLIPTILNIIQVTIGVLALVAVIVIIFAGVQYTTSAGDASIRYYRFSDCNFGLCDCELRAIIFNEKTNNGR